MLVIMPKIQYFLKYLYSKTAKENKKKLVLSGRPHRILKIRNMEGIIKKGMNL